MTDTVFSTTLLPAEDACRFDPPTYPCLIVILGASGDLAGRKIIPSLYRLFLLHLLPRDFAVLGCSRTQLDSPLFRSRLQHSIEQAGADMSRWQEFSEKLYYQQLLYEERASFDALADAIARISDTHKTGANCLYYLALPPFLFETVITLLGQAGLAAEPSGAWRRIIVEKPFGSDLQSAMRLDAILSDCFQERQIFRIDHYLAKETVQNILAFRFANAILRPLWSRKYIEYIDICALETLGIEQRAGYYEKAGVLRDMFQNHMLQLLSLVAMEPPAQFQTETVRTRKAAVFKALRPFALENITDHIALGQYTEGAMDGHLVPGYRQEQGVDPQSLTPTFATMKVFVDNRRWQGVPFYLTSGKRMREKETKIIVQFRDVSRSLFKSDKMLCCGPNRLTFSIQPQEKITLSFRAKNPGPVMCFRPIDLEFCYAGDRGEGLEAYEKVLIDCLNGDQMLSLRQDSEELCWAFLTPLIQDCEQCIRTEQILHFYPAGSPGPAEAEKIRMNQ
ncbi:MAG: glucose-6-phosphate dehydrogenase [Deltaproteobacteria bacterium]|nr:glucose-6-phosphate dehydrogenase [Deltaproteobacteria bacterium]